MQFQVLGAIGAEDEAGRPVELGGPQQRLVLALLLNQPGTVVSTDRLIDQIWGDAAPATARKTIQGYVSSLRRALASDEVLVSREPGYLLDVGRDQIDALRFEDQVAAARAEVNVDPELTAASLREALRLWAGAPYEDLGDVDALRPEIERLEQLRLVAMEDRIRADIASGRASLVTPELESLVQAHPLREEIRALLALSLYRSGRQADALRTIETGRRTMAAEMGVDLSQRLQLLEQRILDHDPILDGPTPFSPTGESPTPTSLRNPYRGLRAFTEADADSFYGRDELVRRIRERMDVRSGPRLIVLAGPSGSGKSSVIRAGLVAGLQADGRPVVTIYPGSEPSTTLTLALEELRGPDAVLVVDQLEEAFTAVDDPADRDGFLSEIGELASRGSWVVATVRADYLGRLMSHSRIAGSLEDALILVPPMSDHEIRAAVAEPAASVGVAVEPELVAEIVSDVGTSASALPLLQYSLTDLFDRRDGGPLTREAYRSAGGLPGALTGRADELYASLSDLGRQTTREAFLRLTTLTEEGEPVRRRVARAALSDLEEIERTLDLFGTHRLLTFDHDHDGEATVEIAHESLLREWPLLGGWTDEARLELAAHHRLAAATNEWINHDHHPDYLLSGTRLARYDGWPVPGVVLTQPEADYLTASAGHEASTRTRRRRRRRLVMAGFAIAAVVALALAAIAVQGQRAAERDRAAAETRAVANEALLQAGQDTELALLLAAEAYGTDPNQADTLLAALLSTTGPSELFEEVEPGRLLGGVVIRTDLGLAALDDIPLLTDSSPASESTVQISESCAVPLGSGRFFTSAGYLADEVGGSFLPYTGATLAAISEAATRSALRVGYPYRCQATASPGGDRIVGSSNPSLPTASLDVPTQTVITDTTSGEILVKVDPRVDRARWGADGRILGIMSLSNDHPDSVRVPDYGGYASFPGELTWVNTQNGSVEPTGVGAVDFDWDPDGSRIFITDSVNGEWPRQEVHKFLVDSTNLDKVADFGMVEPASATTAWSRDGRRVGDVSRSGIIRVWDTGTGAMVTESPVGEDPGEGAWISFAPDGGQAAVVLRRGQVSFIALPSGTRIGAPIAIEQRIAASSFLDDGRLAVVRETGIIEIVDPTSSALVESAMPYEPAGGRISLSDRGDFAWRREGPDLRVFDLSAQDQWTVDGVADGAAGFWVRTDGAVAAITPEFEVIVYNRAGSEVDRGHPFGPVPMTIEPRFHLATVSDDTVAAVVVSEINDFDLPVAVVAGTLDMQTLEALEPPAAFELPPGTTQLFLGPSKLLAYYFGGGLLRQLTLTGEPGGPAVDLGFAIDRGQVSGDGSRALVGGAEGFATIDLDLGTQLDTLETTTPAPLLLLPDNRAAIGLATGDFILWATDPIEQIGLLSRLDTTNTDTAAAFDGSAHIALDTGTEIQRIVIEPGAWAGQACRLAGRSLTESEWTRFVSAEREYEPFC